MDSRRSFTTDALRAVSAFESSSTRPRTADKIASIDPQTRPGDMSFVRQRYSQASEKAINEEMMVAFEDSYAYLSSAFHFDRSDVALPGSSKFFQKLSDEKRALAEKLIGYQNERGATARLLDVKKPGEEASHGELQILTALEKALTREKEYLERLRALHHIAEQEGDAHLADFVEDKLLEPATEFVAKLGSLCTEATRAGKGVGEYVFDQETMAETE